MCTPSESLKRAADSFTDGGQKERKSDDKSRTESRLQSPGS